MLLPSTLFLIFIASVLAPFLSRSLGSRAGWGLAIVPFSLFLLFAWLLSGISQGNVLSFSYSWIPALDVSLIFRLDGLSALMALLITGIGAFIVVYAGGYLKNHPHLHRFYAYLFLFMGAMLGLVLADDLMTLFVFWELTSISSYLLISFKHEDLSSRKKALQALLVTGLGGMCLLAGFILLGQIGGTYQISELIALHDQIITHPLYLPILILILIGAFTKSAQFPFHFWLPNAMAAPTPVSAYLHSATMVKAGVYLLARMTPVVGNTEVWMYTLVSAGAITMLLGASLGFFQTDLKKILAYTTLSVLGMLTMLIGLGTELTLQAAVLFLMGHALYKAALFMVAGSIDHECQTRDITLLRGLRTIMPLTAFAACLAALSKSGFPPFFGFIGKEYVYKSGLNLHGSETLSLIVLGAAITTNIFLLALAFKAGIHPFWGSPSAFVRKKQIHEPPLSMWLGPIVLSVIGLLLGAFPHYLEKPIVESSVSSMIGMPVQLKVALWNGFNLALLLSLITVIGGITLYRFRNWISPQWLPSQKMIGAERIYDFCFNTTLTFAQFQTRLLQSGSLRNYFLITIAATGGLLFFKLIYLGGFPDLLSFENVRFYEYGIIFLMVISTVLSVTTSSRMTALLSLGVVGFGVALIFMFYGTPDLAITQVLVETLTLVLFMLVVYRLPKFKNYSSAKRRGIDAIFSLVIGALITTLILKAQNIQFASSISEQFAEWSYPLAKGKNVVNVILVDFRALDTLGEITVLGIAALGVLALIGKSFRSTSTKEKNS